MALLSHPLPRLSYASIFTIGEIISCEYLGRSSLITGDVDIWSGEKMSQENLMYVGVTTSLLAVREESFLFLHSQQR